MKKIKKTKYYWAFIVLGVLAIIASIILAPIWSFWDKCPWKNWGMSIVSLIIAALVLLYLFGYLLTKCIKTRGTIQILTIVEFVILLLIALGCILSQFNVINIKEACKIFGLILWFEGVIDLFRAYFYRHGSEYKYPIWRLCIAIFLVTFGTWIFVKPFFTNLTVLWIFVVSIFVLGCLLIAYGCLAMPERKKSKKSE